MFYKFVNEMIYQLISKNCTSFFENICLNVFLLLFSPTRLIILYTFGDPKRIISGH